ncbi:MAG: Gfo/Idh/MocA family protein [Candidatus Bipolaricaulia bacterium]
MSSQVHIGIMGTGAIARYHARACRAVPDVEAVAVANWRPESLQRFADEWDIPRRYTDFDELAGDPEVDAVIVGLPNYLHAAETERMLDAGKHVLCEKPMAMNVAEAESMTRTAEQTGKLLMIAMCWRFDIEVRWLQRAIASGLLGEVVKTKLYAIHPSGTGPKGWFVQKKFAGGGVVMDMAVHSLDMALFLLGEPQPKRVYAHIGMRYSTHDVDDEASIVVTWNDGTYSIVETSAYQPHAPEPEGTAEVFGTQGYGRLFPSELRLKTADVHGVVTPEFPERIEHCGWPMYERQIEYFASCVREGKAPFPGGAEGVLMMQLVEAVYESASSGKAVELSW